MRATHERTSEGGENHPSATFESTALKTYSDTKDSGTWWLGEVPAHWGLRRLKSVASNVSELTSEGIADIPYIALEHVESWTGQVAPREADSAESQLKRFRTGDVLFGKLRPYLAKVTCAYSHGLCVGEFLVLRTKSDLVGGFLEQLLRSRCAIDWISSSAFGAKMPRTDWQFVGNMLVPIPPLEEQDRIVRFLQDLTERIKGYIRAKEKLITLLEEQKQVMIHDAVTGRIDVRTGEPYAEYKSFGIGELNEIPKHWDSRPAKRHFCEIDERSVTGLEEELSVSHLTGVTPRTEKKVTMFKAETNIGHKTCRSGDLVINTMWAWMSALGMARQVGLVSPSYAVYRPMRDSLLNPDYAELLLRSAPYQVQFQRLSTGIRPSRMRLYPEVLLRIPLICPPPGEQFAIIEFVESKLVNSNHASNILKNEVERLQEYRTRLIADVVTGKLDVREAADALPQEPTSQEFTAA